jgi:hypothetical protein
MVGVAQIATGYDHKAPLHRRGRVTLWRSHSPWSGELTKGTHNLSDIMPHHIKIGPGRRAFGK